MPHVNYQIELTPENASAIDQINRILLGEGYTQEAPAKTETKASTSKAASKTETKAEPKDTGGEAAEEMTLADFKMVVKTAKADHGEDFVKSILVDNGAKKADPLGRMVSAIDVEDYSDVAAELKAGPGEKASDEKEEDDGLDDDEEEDTSEVTADAVKTAAKAYAKEVGRDEAKQIMNDNGAATLAKIGDCSQKQLQAMFKAFTA